MIQHPPYRRHFALTVVIFLVFIFLGLSAAFLTTRMEHHNYRVGPGIFFSGIIDSLAITPAERGRVLEILNKNQPDPIFSKFWLIDHEGHVLFGPDGGKDPLPFDLKNVSWPTETHAPVPVDVPQTFPRSPRPMVVRLQGEPEQFLVVKFQGKLSPSVRPFFMLSFVTLIIAVILASALSLWAMFYSLRRRARVAEGVIRDIQNGNLKARFPADKLDQMGQTMIAFNTMADEIERLVDRLQSTEQARVSLLQQLTHDLRTPVASLKNLLETLNSRTPVLPAETQAELTSLCLKEVEYFERLVNDLLFLAQMAEPRYRPNQESVALSDLLDEVLETMLSRYQPKGLHLQKDFAPGSLVTAGDSHLLRRLLVNLFDNAFSFARKSVHVRLGLSADGFIDIEVVDDGPGFAETDIAGYGEKKASRRLEAVQNGRLSVGLGSVIIRTVVEAHGGHLAVGNRRGPQGEVLGAMVTVSLRRRQ